MWMDVVEQEVPNAGTQWDGEEQFKFETRILDNSIEQAWGPLKQTSPLAKGLTPYIVRSSELGLYQGTLFLRKWDLIHTLL